MYVGEKSANSRFPGNRWVDFTYQTRTHLMMVRTERRFLRLASESSSNSNADSSNNAGVVEAADVDALAKEPILKIEKFIARYPIVEKVTLADEDVAYFLDLCKGGFE